MFKQIEVRTAIDGLEGNVEELIQRLEGYMDAEDWSTVLSVCIEEEWHSYEDFDTVLVVSRLETQEEHDARLDRERERMARGVLTVQHGLALEEDARRDEVNELKQRIIELENYEES
jgi:hypothetical protein